MPNGARIARQLGATTILSNPKALGGGPSYLKYLPSMSKLRRAGGVQSNSISCLERIAEACSMERASRDQDNIYRFPEEL